jgi:hypothetical protein
MQHVLIPLVWFGALIALFLLINTIRIARKNPTPPQQEITLPQWDFYMQTHRGIQGARELGHGIKGKICILHEKSGVFFRTQETLDRLRVPAPQNS